MHLVDLAGAMAAMRHARCTVVTASVDRLDFLSPIRLGDVVILKAQVNYAHKTSMEVGCRVETEDPRTGERRYTTKAYLTIVAVDEKGRPRAVPPVVPETELDERRHREAEARRKERLRAAHRTGEEE